MANQSLAMSQEQRQIQILAPQLRQSLEMLQAPILELRALVQQELQSNEVKPLHQEYRRYNGDHRSFIEEYMAMVDLFDRITVEPGKCGGKPCIRGMRITVRRVLEILATYPDRAALLAEYPFLEPEDLQQALRYAAATVDDERLSVDRVA